MIQGQVVRQIPDPARGILAEFATIEDVLPGDVLRVRYSDGTLGDARASAFESIQDAARRILREARADLGDDLGGFSALDLLADNLPGTLPDLRAILERIEDR